MENYYDIIKDYSEERKTELDTQYAIVNNLKTYKNTYVKNIIKASIDNMATYVKTYLNNAYSACSSMVNTINSTIALMKTNIDNDTIYKEYYKTIYNIIQLIKYDESVDTITYNNNKYYVKRDSILKIFIGDNFIVSNDNIYINNIKSYSEVDLSSMKLLNVTVDSTLYNILCGYIKILETIKENVEASNKLSREIELEFFKEVNSMAFQYEKMSEEIKEEFEENPSIFKSRLKREAIEYVLRNKGTLKITENINSAEEYLRSEGSNSDFEQKVDQIYNFFYQLMYQGIDDMFSFSESDIKRMYDYSSDISAEDLKGYLTVEKKYFTTAILNNSLQFLKNMNFLNGKTFSASVEGFYPMFEYLVIETLREGTGTIETEGGSIYKLSIQTPYKEFINYLISHGNSDEEIDASKRFLEDNE